VSDPIDLVAEVGRLRADLDRALTDGAASHDGDPMTSPILAGIILTAIFVLTASLVRPSWWQ
jgi:hypothetical protein